MGADLLRLDGAGIKGAVKGQYEMPQLNICVGLITLIRNYTLVAALFLNLERS